MRRTKGTIEPARPSALLTDFYQLTMLDAYWKNSMEAEAVFELFVRKLPPGRGFLMSAGLEQAMDHLENFRFGEDELSWLSEAGNFTGDFLDRLAKLRFTGSVHAIPEGMAFFAAEPLIRVTAPLPAAQLAETRLMNILHHQTLVASKAARCVVAAEGRHLVDFGLRRAHGAEAALFAARASYIAGFSSTSNVLASRLYGIPMVGTMAHSFVMATGDEELAFSRFAQARPDHLTVLIDTYDTEKGAEKVARLATVLKEAGASLKGVRIDSGDLGIHARRVREILDRAGLTGVRIVASGNLDEFEIERLVGSGAPVDTFAVGTKVAVGADAPYLECAYKLIEYDGRPTVKLSEGKVNLPGRKQVFRSSDPDGIFGSDSMVLDGEETTGVPIVVEVMRSGARTGEAEPLATSRERAAAQLANLSPAVRSMKATAAHPVKVSDSIRALSTKLARG